MDIWAVAISRCAVPNRVARPLRYGGVLTYGRYRVHFGALGPVLRAFHIRLSADEPAVGLGSPMADLDDAPTPRGAYFAWERSSFAFATLRNS